MNDLTTSLIECAGFALPMSVVCYLDLLLLESSARNLGRPIRLPHKRFSFFFFLGFFGIAFACVFLTGEGGVPVTVLGGLAGVGLLVALPTWLVTVAMRSSKTKTDGELAATVALEDSDEPPGDTRQSEEGFLMQCTGCGQEMDVPFQMSGQDFQCPTCGTANTATDSTGPDADQSEGVENETALPDHTLAKRVFIGLAVVGSVMGWAAALVAQDHSPNTASFDLVKVILISGLFLGNLVLLMGYRVTTVLFPRWKVLRRRKIFERDKNRSASNQMQGSWTRRLWFFFLDRVAEVASAIRGKPPPKDN